MLGLKAGEVGVTSYHLVCSSSLSFLKLCPGPRQGPRLSVEGTSPKDMDIGRISLLSPTWIFPCSIQFAFSNFECVSGPYLQLGTLVPHL